jgi:hypothetical protein
MLDDNPAGGTYRPETKRTEEEPVYLARVRIACDKGRSGKLSCQPKGEVT